MEHCHERRLTRSRHEWTRACPPYTESQVPLNDASLNRVSGEEQIISSAAIRGIETLIATRFRASQGSRNGLQRSPDGFGRSIQPVSSDPRNHCLPLSLPHRGALTAASAREGASASSEREDAANNLGRACSSCCLPVRANSPWDNGFPRAIFSC